MPSKNSPQDPWTTPSELTRTVDTQAILAQRNANLDAIRGLAVLGIFFMNIYFMGITFFGYAPHETPPLSDHIIKVFSNFFIEARFISLFSILFGVGLFIQYQRFNAQGLSAYSLLRSRLSWLIVFGLIHGIIIWPGDILFTYGVSGFLALCYKELSIEALKRKANIFIFIALVIITLISLTGSDDPFTRESSLFAQQYTAWTSSYADQLLLHLMQVGYMALVIPFTLMWFTAGLMLLGMALYQQGTFERGFSKSELLKLVLASVTLSLLATILGLTPNPTLAVFSDVLIMLSAIPMALIYIHIMVKLCQNNPKKLIALQNVGKLAFSFYILQSIVGVLVFRHLAPEWIVSLDRGEYMVMALVYSVVQLLLASLYLRYFEQGPLEKLWRHLAFKKQAASQEHKQA
ncbi:DUF418 domain-containing protein [Shewanella sp. CG12_big_fil_rev_8_21_14_0_65_47_15]|uniref:DUF418 domain-containing protein n=1 Tax=Shewanella sp. CG12_big_fil_rev_8_21_14_0_65_47_15 TaxID=1975537 RepID=UPI000CABFB1A|nr:DUF418 domain-containing protein [Shewanella sp. CG12_big_fil_rev_8_21_14_0_65_47_15]PIW59452.1 MAG: hypothetical protein COW15_17610 [Shewanella sp. CG12_big_fil_rev_8_21_14_0_65_47_15]